MDCFVLLRYARSPRNDGNTVMLTIRRMEADEFSLIWPFFQCIVAAGDSYGYDPKLTQEQARAVWCAPDRVCYVASNDKEQAVGSFYLRPNQQGPGAHVANGGVMVDPDYAGKGYGTALGRAMLEEAGKLGYQAIQFNFVAETNIASLAIWKKLGFAEIGHVPDAFHHPADGYVAVKLLYKRL